MDCLTAEKMALEIQRYPTGNIRLQVINGKHTHTQCECSGVLKRVLTNNLTDTVDPSSLSVASTIQWTTLQQYL